MAAERAVREAQATLLAAAGIDQPAELQIWGCQNWKGAGWPMLRGDNPLEEPFMEAHGIEPMLPGGTAADDELVRLQRLGDAAGFAARIKELYETERRFEAPGLWGRFNESRVSPGRVGQLSTLFVNAKKGDLVIMTSSGKYGDPELQVENTRYVIGMFTTDPVPEGIVWRTPEEMGVHAAVYAPGELERHFRERTTEEKFRKEADGRFTRVLEGPLATRPVRWLVAGRLYDLSEKHRKYLSVAGVKTIAPMYNYSVVQALIDKGSRIVRAEAVGKRIRVWWPSEDKWFGGEVASFDGRRHGIRYDDGDEDLVDLANHTFEIVETAAGAHDAASDPEEAPETAAQPAPPPPRAPRRAAPPPPDAPRRAPPLRPQKAGDAGIRVGAVVEATLHAWPRELKKHGPRFRARGRVVEQGTADELDDDCPEELRKGRVWHVDYDVDKEVFPTPECCLSLVEHPRHTPDAPAAPATPDADRAPGAPVTPEDEDGPPARDPPRATAAAPGSIMATFQCQLSDTLWSKQQIKSLMPNEQGSHIPAVYAAGGVIYALCFSEDANPSLPTVLEISCGARRKQQVALLEALKQRGGTVPLFVCLQTAHGRLELLPGGSGSKGFRFAGMRSVASVQIHSTPKMVGGEARQATVTLSAPTAGGTCPLQVAGIPRAIQVVGAPVTPEDDDEPEFIETRGSNSKKRARRGSTLRDKRDEEQAKALKKVKEEESEARELADQLVLSENNKMSEIDELRRTVSERDSRIEALEAEAREKDATIAELRGRMGQLDDALAAVDAIRNRPRV